MLPVIGIFIAATMAIFAKKSNKLISTLLYLPILVTELVVMIIIYNDFTDLTNGYKITDNFILHGFTISIVIFIQALLILIGIFSIFYIREKDQSTYFALFYSMNLGIILIFTVSHLFLLFISWELMVLTGYLLVLFPKTEESLEAGFKYLVISTVGSLNILFGIGLLSGISTDLSYSNISSTAITDELLGKLGFTFLILGFGVTAGMIFLNQWLPDAHPAAPAPVSAVLSGIMVNAGIYGMYITYQLMTNSTTEILSAQVIVIIATITMTEANLLIIVQFLRDDSKDIKRILAYSTIVHLSYLMVITPFALGDGSMILLLHIFTHGIAKTLLFLITGYFLMLTGSRDLRDLRGIGRKYKSIGVIIFIALMSLGGLPGTGGFVSKLLILLLFYQKIDQMELFSNSVNEVFVLILIINGFLAFIGYLWLMKYLIFDEPNEETKIKPLSKLNDNIIKGVLIILTLSLLFIGLFPDEVLSRISVKLP
ncbi:MAG: Hydrogenase-4 component B [Candidatus Heimdallarchaeota archaeon LC_2]|nr:MAG: Hydrogenase-4 component B [Candidatus Heimdallarchaeota archaeon LC_2]